MSASPAPVLLPSEWAGWGETLVARGREVALAALPYALAAAALLGALSLVSALLRSQSRRLGETGRAIRILPPPELHPAGAEVLWLGLHALLRPWWKRVVFGQPPLCWELVAGEGEAHVRLWVPAGTPPGLVERAVEAAWPGARTSPAGEAREDLVLPASSAVCATDLLLAAPQCFPLGEPPAEQPLALVMGALGGLAQGEQVVIQVLARPATAAARRRLRREATRLKIAQRRAASAGPVAVVDPSATADIRAVVGKAESILWHCLVRVAVVAPDRPRARGRIHAVAGAFAVFSGRNRFRRGRLHRQRRALCARRLARPYLLSVPELARIATLPAAGSLPGLDRAGARSVAPPRALPGCGKVLGLGDHPGTPRPVAVSVADARHHFHVVGETGTGKSTAIAQLALGDAEAGRAAVVIDPKGDLVDWILERLPRGIEERCCLIDPEDPQVAVGLNVLEGDNPDLVTDHVVGVFRRIYGPWWGPRTDDIMRAACLTLCQIPGATLAEVPLILTHAEWRREILRRMDEATLAGAGRAASATLRSFWTWYERLPEAQRAAHIAPLLNKLRAFLLRGPVRAIVGQSAPRRDVTSLLDTGGLLLVRLPKGNLGEDTSRLLGAFVIARVWQAAMKRAGVPEAERADAALYVDEMHNYMALPRSFEDLLAEARGYRLSLVLAHQHLGQLSREMREALDANARTKLVFACSPDDAGQLERHFLPALRAHDLSHLSFGHAACRPCLGGGHGEPFTLHTRPLPEGSPARAAAARRATAELWARPRREVELAIERRQLRPGEDLLPPRVGHLPEGGLPMQPAPGASPGAQPVTGPLYESPLGRPVGQRGGPQGTPTRVDGRPYTVIQGEQE